MDFRSLTTGSSSHKTVTSDVSRILWYYYNDSVGIFYHQTNPYPSNLPKKKTAYSLRLLLRQRTLLRLPLPQPLLDYSLDGQLSHSHRYPNLGAHCRSPQVGRRGDQCVEELELAASGGRYDFPDLCGEADYQCCAILEG